MLDLPKSDFESKSLNYRNVISVSAWKKLFKKNNKLTNKQV